MPIIRQGEVRLAPINALPTFEMTRIEPTNGAIVVGESESHHHHVLDADGVTVLERITDVPAGMKILYAIAENPTLLRQTAGNPHETHHIQTGIYEIRIKRDFNPFLQEARRVID